MSEAKRPSREKIAEVLNQFGVAVSPSLAGQISAYMDLLLFWNGKINLTSITDPLKILEAHFGESLFGAFSQGIISGELLDVGSGAGFPALPIAMIRPEIRATLLEATGKKAAFLSEVSRKLELADRVSVVRSRLEDLDPAARADFITSRAVRVTSQFLAQSSRLLRPGGKLVLWLGMAGASALVGNAGWMWGTPERIPRRAEGCVISGTPKGN